MASTENTGWQPAKKSTWWENRVSAHNQRQQRNLYKKRLKDGHKAAKRSLRFDSSAYDNDGGSNENARIYKKAQKMSNGRAGPKIWAATKLLAMALGTATAACTMPIWLPVAAPIAASLATSSTVLSAVGAAVGATLGVVGVNASVKKIKSIIEHNKIAVNENTNDIITARSLVSDAKTKTIAMAKRMQRVVSYKALEAMRAATLVVVPFTETYRAIANTGYKATHLNAKATDVAIMLDRKNSQEGGVVSVAQAKADLKQAKAALKLEASPAAKETLTNAEASVKASKESLAQAKVSLKERKAQLGDVIQDQLVAATQFDRPRQLGIQTTELSEKLVTAEEFFTNIVLPLQKAGGVLGQTFGASEKAFFKRLEDPTSAMRARLNAYRSEDLEGNSYAPVYDKPAFEGASAGVSVGKQDLTIEEYVDYRANAKSCYYSHDRAENSSVKVYPVWYLMQTATKDDAVSRDGTISARAMNAVLSRAMGTGGFLRAEAFVNRLEQLEDKYSVLKRIQRKAYKSTAKPAVAQTVRPRLPEEIERQDMLAITNTAKPVISKIAPIESKEPEVLDFSSVHVTYTKGAAPKVKSSDLERFSSSDLKVLFEEIKMKQVAIDSGRRAANINGESYVNLNSPEHFDVNLDDETVASNALKAAPHPMRA